MSKSVDLTTLTGWANLADGTHNITVVAKATGYQDSDPSTAVQVRKGIVIPAKGDLITIESKQYRVLKTNGSVAEVLAMYTASSSQKFDASSPYTNVYADNSLDVYLSQTFYNSLSTSIQNAIVAKTFTQDEWSWTSGTSGGTGTAIYQCSYSSSQYRVGLTNASYGTSISRKCYVLSVQDVIDYLEVTTSMDMASTTLTSANVWLMFWNQTTSPGNSTTYYPWLRSAISASSGIVFYVNGRSGYLGDDVVVSARAVRPAFQIDLSKIEWTKQ